MIYRYKNPEMFKDLDKPDFRQYSGNIVLWGAGKIGGVSAHVFKQKGIDIIAFVDISKVKQGSTFCNIKVISPETFLNDYGDSTLIITTVGRNDVVEWLVGNNFNNFFDVWSLLLEFDFDDYSEQDQMYMTKMVDRYFRTILRCYRIKPKHIAERLKAVITSKCSLQCKECIMAIPFLKDRRHIIWSEILSDIRVSLDAIGYFEDLELFGGESFLHPDLDKIIIGLNAEKRIDTICIATNGTIIPNMKVINAMRNDERILVRISNYGSISNKCKEICELLDSNLIKYEMKNLANWYKKPEFKKTNEDETTLARKFLTCMNGCGPLIWDGKLFLCACPWVFIETGQLIEAEDNFLNLRNSRITNAKLLRNIYNYINRTNTGEFINACYYCTGYPNADFRNEIPAAEQV